MGLSTLCKSLMEQQSCMSYLTCSRSLLRLNGDELESKEESVVNSWALQDWESLHIAKGVLSLLLLSSELTGQSELFRCYFALCCNCSKWVPLCWILLPLTGHLIVTKTKMYLQAKCLSLQTVLELTLKNHFSSPVFFVLIFFLFLFKSCCSWEEWGIDCFHYHYFRMGGRRS